MWSDSTESMVGKANPDSYKAGPNTWLNTYARNVTSQGGEDGIIEKILDVINQTNKWCVEFGSWDGKTLSNTYNLIKNYDYSAVLIECDRVRYEKLLQTFEGNEKVIPVNALVGFNPEDSLDVILKKTPIPKDFDLLSIDIDGNDYHVWEAVREYQPKVVLIEFNATIPPSVEFVQPRDIHVTQGSSLLSINKLAQKKGYELVCVKSNAIFVGRQYFPLFNIRDNSIDEMWTDQSAISHIFFGYDGTVFLSGHKKLPWQNIELRESKVQQLPRWAIKRVGDRNFIRKNLGKWYRRLRSKNIL